MEVEVDMLQGAAAISLGQFVPFGSCKTHEILLESAASSTEVQRRMMQRAEWKRAGNGLAADLRLTECSNAAGPSPDAVFLSCLGLSLCAHSQQSAAPRVSGHTI